MLYRNMIAHKTGQFLALVATTHLVVIIVYSSLDVLISA